ncbi:iron-sulfur cluster biosynthesis family protein [Virgibacillus sp. MSP4-1]|uniref:iron-sulfur cluster biosynthesis family protein n=1 Tax=Virgibacillus sp. MSP4-1 TaxID=2700081 RepID=UPI0003A8C499|nr:iron-sulfur cluster biosynthesis family protein [Virgibacillus sp. MSP4-1]QHS22441.1 iron-sulfur cluster biosynthesis family protein [Virgibacillus sp. MSP4-1]
MELKITASAEKALKELNKKGDSYLLLWYDTDDCGCGVNGLPMVSFVRELNSDYQKVENDIYPTYIDRQQAVFFHPNLKLDVVNNGTFRLSSPEGILNPFISAFKVKSI